MELLELMKMKHLKKYNENSDISKSDLQDICLELEDNGFEVEFKYRYGLNHIKISKNNKSFKYDEVKEVMLRLKEYLGDLYEKTLVYQALDYYICDFDEVSLNGLAEPDASWNATTEEVNLTNANIHKVIIIHRYNEYY